MLFALANYAVNVRHIISDFQHGSKRAKTQSADKTVLHLAVPPIRIQLIHTGSYNNVVTHWQDAPSLTTHLDFSLYNRPPPLA